MNIANNSEPFLQMKLDIYRNELGMIQVQKAVSVSFDNATMR